MTDSGALMGQVAVVTGAGRGLGRAYAEALAARGARICVAELDPGTGQNSADALAGARFCQLDVGDSASVQRCAEFVSSEFGRVDILINNAGNPGLVSSLDITRAQWDDVLRVNLVSTLLCSQVFGRHMIAQGHGGAIVNVSSIAAHPRFPCARATARPKPDQRAYQLPGRGVGASSASASTPLRQA